MPTPTGEIVPFFLSIAGNIGVGKTMVCDLVSERMGWDSYYEPVLDNPYLEPFYGDMTRWSFHLQVFFLSRRFALQRQLLERGRSAVQDRSMYEDSEIFARILYRRGHMEERDYHAYRDLFAEMAGYLRAPDLIVYMKASPATTMERIARRGRGMESGIDPDYITELHNAYENWAAHIHRIAPVLVVDTERLDLKHDGAAQDRLVADIAKASREKQLRALVDLGHSASAAAEVVDGQRELDPDAAAEALRRHQRIEWKQVVAHSPVAHRWAS